MTEKKRPEKSDVEIITEHFEKTLKLVVDNNKTNSADIRAAELLEKLETKAKEKVVSVIPIQDNTMSCAMYFELDIIEDAIKSLVKFKINNEEMSVHQTDFGFGAMRINLTKLTNKIGEEIATKVVQKAIAETYKNQSNTFSRVEKIVEKDDVIYLQFQQRHINEKI